MKTRAIPYPDRWLAVVLLLTALGWACASEPEPTPRRALPLVRFADLDSDGSKALNPEEFAVFAQKMFVQLDSDHDGSLSEAEYKALFQRDRPRGDGERRRGPRRGGGQGPGGGGGGYPGGGFPGMPLRSFE